MTGGNPCVNVRPCYPNSTAAGSFPILAAAGFSMRDRGRDRLESLSLLVSKTTRLEERVDGRSPNGEGWEGLAAQLAHVSSKAADLARAMYLLDAGALQRVHARLYDLCGFRNGPIANLGASFVTATRQVIAVPKGCGACNGAGRLRAGYIEALDGDTGEWLRLPHYEPCLACGETGFEPASAEYVRETLRVSPAVWFALFAAPFDMLVEVLNEWMTHAYTALQEID